MTQTHVCAPILDPNSNKLFVLSCQMLSLGKLGEKYNGFAYNFYVRLKLFQNKKSLVTHLSLIY